MGFCSAPWERAVSQANGSHGPLWHQDYSLNRLHNRHLFWQHLLASDWGPPMTTRPSKHSDFLPVDSTGFIVLAVIGMVLTVGGVLVLGRAVVDYLLAQSLASRSHRTASPGESKQRLRNSTWGSGRLLRSRVVIAWRRVGFRIQSCYPCGR